MTAHGTAATRRGKPRGWMLGLLVAAGVLALAAPVSAQPIRPTSSAQSCNPAYGCTTTTTAPSGVIRCRTSIHIGSRGIRIVIVCNVRPGTIVRVLWNGRVVVTGPMTAGSGGVAPAAAGAGQVFNGPDAVETSAQAASESHIDYLAPSLPNGTYDVVIAGDSFNAPVGPFTLTGSGVVGTSNPSSSGSSLANTGVTAMLWVAVAGSIVGIGYVLSRSNRRRRHPY